MNAIEIKNSTKRFKELTAVQDLCLEIKTGELFGLLGVNGAGKTTTIKMLCGLLKIDSGDAFLMGKSVKNEGGDIKKIIAVSPQESAVAPNLTVLENLDLICGVHGIKKADRNNKIENLLEILKLDEVKNKKAGKLSGGYARRLSIALALVSEPEILFLDEPTAMLDVISRSELWDIIKALKGKITIVLTTHYMEEAEALCDRVGIMRDGRLLACDTVENIKLKAETESFENAFIKIVKGEVQ